MKHSTNPQTRRGRGPARRIGRTLALVLPVFLVLSGTLAVTRVNWTGSPSDSVLTASDISAARAKARAPQDVLRDKLLAELQEENPGIALTHLQEAVNDRPSLAKHCASIARALGRAAVRVYGPTRAQSYARPVCDTSFATGVAASHT
ncbi:hypothetical protein B1R27_13995 [Streptomyces sp. GKU 895]|nr:hypothetical protein B1R27_13995 [Streptomyces sp. GKU 895]